MNARLETFCDGVFAIAITLLIIEIKVPPVESVHSVADVWRAFLHLWPSFFALSLSFGIIFISWLGHHNLLKNIERTSTPFQLANGYLLFTVILMPFFAAFMAEYLNTPFAQPAIVCYSLVSLLHNTGWLFLHRSIASADPPLVKDPIARELGTEGIPGGTVRIRHLRRPRPVGVVVAVRRFASDRADLAILAVCLDYREAPGTVPLRIDRSAPPQRRLPYLRTIMGESIRL